ncbi:hypothetical protein KR222_004531, partial [Zaprionus bogoriensis]
NSSAIHILHVPDIEPFAVPCQSDIQDGGWTVIQRRLDGTVNFERSWNEYRNGFGDLKGEFFIGLEKLHRMTKAQPHELYIQFETFHYHTSYALFRNLTIDSEEESYRLTSLISMSNTAGCNSCMLSSIGQKFTTFDRDNDHYWWGNCAKEFRGGWWFESCASN